MEIRASRVVIEDASCRDRIVMEMGKDEPSIKLYGVNGEFEINICIRNDTNCTHDYSY